MKKLLALILSCLMVMSLCVVSVSAERVKNQGDIILADDFESDYTIADSGHTVVSNASGEKTGYYYDLTLKKYNNEYVWSSQFTNIEGIEKKLESAEWSGAGNLVKVTYNTTVKSYAGNLAASGKYPSAWFQIYDTKYVPLVHIFSIPGAEASQGAGIKLSPETFVDDLTDAVIFSANEEHTIEILLDKNNNTVGINIDGEVAISPTTPAQAIPNMNNKAYFCLSASDKAKEYAVDQNGVWPEVIVHSWSLEKYIPDVDLDPDADIPVTYTTSAGGSGNVTGTIPAGTTELHLQFGARMIGSTLNNNNITLTGDLGEGSYTVAPDPDNNRAAIVTFTDGLMPETNYTLSISAGVKSAFGTSVTARTVSFATGAGELTYYAPAVSVAAAADVTLGSNIAVTPMLTNSAKADFTVYVILAAYKDGAMTALDKAVIDEDTVVANFTATEGFVGADELKAWYISDIVNIKPLADPVVIQ